ncbi:MAG: helix-hairpin-helix domain-containing protein [Oscillospiraceae bacterium]|nr:helix-hairpin-helix domain-containing protein [Oscillospiraceae bacterium]
MAFALILISGVLLFNIVESKTEDKVPAVTTEATSQKETTNNYSSEVSKTDTNFENTTKSNLININTATIDELQKLNGIGEAKAKAIVDFRETNGLFPTVKSIINVPGIGEKTLEKIIDDITV